MYNFVTFHSLLSFKNLCKRQYSQILSTMKRFTTIIFSLFLSLKILAPATTFDRVTNILSSIKEQSLQQEWQKWKQLLAFKESSNRYNAINPQGCIGKYQFQISTLRYLGFKNITVENFKSTFSAEIQEQALEKLIHANELLLSHLQQYVGKTVRGILITKSGLLAASHLAGVGGVSKFLKSDKNPTDCNNTSVRDYLQQFSQFKI
jgi:hypothetical protein